MGSDLEAGNSRLLAPYDCKPTTASSILRFMTSMRFPDFNVSLNDSADFDVYQSSGENEITVMSQLIAHDPEYLLGYIKIISRIAPLCFVRVRGTHERIFCGNAHQEKEAVDFSYRISMNERLATPWRRMKVSPNGRRKYVQPGAGQSQFIETKKREDSLVQWCRDFCAVKWKPKEFKLTVKVIDPDEVEVRRNIEGVLRKIKYGGNIQVAMEGQQHVIVLTTKHWMTRLRLNRLFWWTCVILQLWIVTWPLLWLLTEKWNVVKVDWPTKIQSNADGILPIQDECDPESIHKGESMDNGKARVVNFPAEQWVQNWEAAIARSALKHSTDRKVESPIKDEANIPWKALGNFEETQAWGLDEQWKF